MRKEALYRVVVDASVNFTVRAASPEEAVRQGEIIRERIAQGEGVRVPELNFGWIDPVLYIDEDGAVGYESAEGE